MNSLESTKEPSEPSTMKSTDAELSPTPHSQRERDIIILQIDIQRHSNRLQYDRTLSPEEKETIQQRLAYQEAELSELTKEVKDG